MFQVTCLSCGWMVDRNVHQRELAALNPDWEALRLAQMAGDAAASAQRPDGDMDTGALDTTRFRYPQCPHCAASAYACWHTELTPAQLQQFDGYSQHELRRRSSVEHRAMLKPAVSFFGESLHPALKENAQRMVMDSDGLLVLGSSLRTYSAYFASLNYRASIVILRRTPGELEWNNLVLIRKPWDDAHTVP